MNKEAYNYHLFINNLDGKTYKYSGPLISIDRVLVNYANENDFLEKLIPEYNPDLWNNCEISIKNKKEEIIPIVWNDNDLLSEFIKSNPELNASKVELNYKSEIFNTISEKLNNENCMEYLINCRAFPRDWENRKISPAFLNSYLQIRKLLIAIHEYELFSKNIIPKKTPKKVEKELTLEQQEKCIYISKLLSQFFKEKRPIEEKNMISTLSLEELIALTKNIDYYGMPDDLEMMKKMTKTDYQLPLFKL